MKLMYVYTHTHTKFSLYIYIYIYIYVCVCARGFGHHFLVKTYINGKMDKSNTYKGFGSSDISYKQYKHFLSTYFCFDPFKLRYGCYNVRSELPFKLSVIGSQVLSDPSWATICTVESSVCVCVIIIINK